jgi:BirA family biotin operon repressor/biotin-[acetyl-CoA-carboxylase] ligase
MTDPETLLEAAASAGAAAGSLFEKVTASTQATAMRLAEDGADEWTVVVAGHQTSGRGRLGREWSSEPGTSLLFSVVLRPRIAPAKSGLVTLLAGAAMAEAARVSAGVEVRCKWPNDLLVEGKKAGGILAEGKVSSDELRYVVLGVGMNVTAPPAGFPEAGSVSASADPALLLHSFLMIMKQRWHTHSPRFADEVVSAWRACSATLGKRVSADTVDGSRIEGVALDVDRDGALLLQTDDGARTVSFGEIQHLG